MAWMLNVTGLPGTASFSSGGWEVIIGGSAACENRKTECDYSLHIRY